jgi:hypothetical protein
MSFPLVLLAVTALPAALLVVAAEVNFAIQVRRYNRMKREFVELFGHLPNDEDAADVDWDVDPRDIIP